MREGGVRSRRSFVITVAMVATIVPSVVACGDPSTSSSATPASAQPDDHASVAVDAGELRGVGTPLHGSVKVLAGTHLVGSVAPLQQPNSNVTPDPSAWQALLLVTGEPIAVWDRYAHELGIGETATAPASCVVDRVDAAPDPAETTSASVVAHQRFLTEPRVDGENQVRCSAALDGVSMTLLAGAARRCDPPLGGGPTRTCDLRRVDQLHVQVSSAITSPDLPPMLGADDLRYNRAVPPRITSGSDTSGSAPATNPTPVPVPPGHVITPQLDTTHATSSLPRPGESIDDGLDYYIHDDPSLGGSDTPLFPVPPNGRSLIAPALMGGCNSGLVAALRVDATPEQVAGYFDGRQPNDEPIVTRTGTNPDGTTWLSGEIATAGGYYLDLSITAATPARSDVLVTECGD